MSGSTRRPPGKVAIGTAVLVLALLAGAFVVTRDSGSEPVVAATTTTTSTTIPPTTTATVPPTEVPPVTLLASPKGEVPTYDGPNGAQVGTVGLWYGYPMTMPIVEERGEWLRIMMPERLNMLTAWCSVTRSTSPWRMVLTLSEYRVRV